MKDDLTRDDEATHAATKQQRAVGFIAPLLAAYTDAIGGNDDRQTTVTDLLTDLHHYADATGLDFQAALDGAVLHHDAESDDLNGPASAVAAAITRLFPTATFYGLSSNDQGNYGYTLVSVGFEDSTIIDADSDRFTELAIELYDALGDLSWGAFGDRNRDSDFDVDITTGKIIRRTSA